MAYYVFSEHARDMLTQRKVREAWAKSATEDLDRKETRQDGTIHYIKSIEEHGGRHLRVVVNPATSPARVVTLFFDRKLGRLI